MKRFLDGHWGKGLLLEYVYLEVVTVLMVRAGLATAQMAAQLFLESEELEFVPCSDFFADTVSTFAHQRNTKFSFTDSAIATIALKRADGFVLVQVSGDEFDGGNPPLANQRGQIQQIDPQLNGATAGSLGRHRAAPAGCHATMVQRLIEAGGIPLAKINLPDLLFQPL